MMAESPARLLQLIVMLALAVCFASAWLPRGVREPVQETAWFVLMLSVCSAFVWGNAADEAYDISERMRPGWWPLRYDRLEARRSMRHMAMGAAGFVTSLYLTVMFSRPWIAAVGIVVFLGTMWWVGGRAVLRTDGHRLARVARDAIVVVMLLLITGCGVELLVALLWHADLVDLIAARCT
jgi:hypothetical protein